MSVTRLYRLYSIEIHADNISLEVLQVHIATFLYYAHSLSTFQSCCKLVVYYNKLPLLFIHQSDY